MQLHGWEALIFYILAFSTLIMGVLVVSSRTAIHSALFLLGTLINIALLFILLRAEFAAGVQILVYAGGAVTLFILVISLLPVRATEVSPDELYTKQMWPAVILALLLAGSFFLAVNPAQPAFRPSADLRQSDPGLNDTRKELAGAGSTVSNDTQNIGEAMYQQAVLPFEITGILLLVTLVGAAALRRAAKPEQVEAEAESATRAAEETTEPENGDEIGENPPVEQVTENNS